MTPGDLRPELATYRGRALQRVRTRLIVAVGSMAVLSVAMAAVLVVGVHRHGVDNVRLGVLVALVVVLLVTPVLVIGCLLRRNVRRHGSMAGRPALVAGAPRENRRAVRRALHRRQLPTTEPDRTIAVDLAQRLVSARTARFPAVILGGLAILQVPVLVTADSWSVRLRTAGVIVMLAGIAALNRREVSGARSLLAQVDGTETGGLDGVAERR